MENVEGINKLKKKNERLKAENEILKSRIKDLRIRKDRYYFKGLEQEQQISDCVTRLLKIKAIAENNIDCKQYEIDHDCFNDTRCKALRELIETLQQILDLITKAEEE